MKTFAAIAIALFLCTTAQAADRPTVSVTHKMGTISVPVNPERVTVMDFGALDTLDALGVKASLALPRNNLPGYLAKYNNESYVSVGGLKEFNLETINAFKPELIIISGRQQDYYNQLSAIAPVLFVDSIAQDYVPSVKKNLDAIGTIFAATDRVETAWAAIMESAARVRRKAADANLKALILLTNDGKISAYGSKSRFGIIHDELGLLQADPQIKVGIHGQLVNYEYIAMIDPDIIFVVDRSAAVSGKADGARLLDNALVNRTKAAKNGRIISLSQDIWYLSGGGLQSLAAMVAEIEAALDKK